MIVNKADDCSRIQLKYESYQMKNKGPHLSASYCNDNNVPLFYVDFSTTKNSFIKLHRNFTFSREAVFFQMQLN